MVLICTEITLSLVSTLKRSPRPRPNSMAHHHAVDTEPGHLAVDSLAVDGGPVLGDLPDARVQLVLGRLPLVVPPRGDGAVAPRVRGAAQVATRERVRDVRAVQGLVGGAEVGDGGLDLVAGRVELGLVVDAAGLGGAELDGVAGAEWKKVSVHVPSAVCFYTKDIGYPACCA